jgi:hypothetical protein
LNCPRRELSVLLSKSYAYGKTLVGQLAFNNTTCPKGFLKESPSRTWCEEQGVEAEGVFFEIRYVSLPCVLSFVILFKCLKDFGSMIIPGNAGPPQVDCNWASITCQPGPEAQSATAESTGELQCVCFAGD